MKYFAIIILCFCTCATYGQKKVFSVLNISLPPEISYYDNQFSGLYIYDDKLFLMSESRLQDSAEAKLYAIKLSDLNRKMEDTSFILPFKKYHIYNTQLLRAKMKASGDEYEGLEAMVIKESEVYFSVETTTPSANCYLLRGQINDSAIILQPDFLIAMPKPVNIDGTHIYNAGFEAMANITKNAVVAFFEYNYFQDSNYARWISPWPFKNNGNHNTLPIEPLPFRITDITGTRKNRFTAINYFYKGEGDDKVYRMPPEDKNGNLIMDSSGYHSYSRLVELKFKNLKFTWKPLWELPKEYWGYNWEGIASYKKGYFIINDKYTPARPYRSVLLYLKKKNS